LRDLEPTQGGADPAEKEKTQDFTTVRSRCALNGTRCVAGGRRNLKRLAFTTIRKNVFSAFNQALHSFPEQLQKQGVSNSFSPSQPTALSLPRVWFCRGLWRCSFNKQTSLPIFTAASREGFSKNLYVPDAPATAPDAQRPPATVREKKIDA
jgi:hypothetical protein